MEQGEQDTSPDLVDDLTDATGLSEAAVRSVLWQTRRAGWRIVRTEPTGEPGRTAVYITEEWTP